MKNYRCTNIVFGLLLCGGLAVQSQINTIINEDNGYLLKSLDELQHLFNELRINEKSTLITYCGSGIWASPIYFVARLLGYRVRFYNASFQEWGNNESLPIAVTFDK
jgi:3-mercaptopyruvate sulfurtransferase SseA